MIDGKLLSIVIPVYKVEPYIDKCLSSLVLENSSLMDRLEVILVNDGTPDNSAEMSREYAKRYPNTFRQIDKENGGHGSAWNVGLKEATGKYLRFLDSDDWFTNLDRLLLDLNDCDADLVFNPFIKEYSYESRTEIVEVPFLADGTSFIDPSLWGASKWGYNNVNFWSTTYKTAILKPLQPLFAERTMFDDYIITWAPLVHGRTYRSLDYPIYHYLLGRPNQSMSATHQRKGAESYVKCFAKYEEVRSRINTGIDAIPSDMLNCIDASIAGYAGFIFSYMVYLPYGKSRTQMSYLWARYLKDRQYKSNLMKRFAVLPFPVFYYVEHLRRRIHHA